MLLLRLRTPLLLDCYWINPRETEMRGHIRQRGKAWEVRVYAGRDTLTGHERVVTRTVHGGKRQVSVWPVPVHRPGRNHCASRCRDGTIGVGAVGRFVGIAAVDDLLVRLAADRLYVPPQHG